MTQKIHVTYEEEILAWQRHKEEVLRGDDGWLTVAGLFWLHDGVNTVGSDPDCEVALPPDSTPAQIGTLTLHEGHVHLLVTCAEPVTIDGAPMIDAHLRADSDPAGPSLITSRAVTFFVIQRGTRFAIRVRDRKNPERLAFTGCIWYPVDPAYRLPARLIRHETPRTLAILNTVGMTETMNNLGVVEFELHGQRLRLEALEKDLTEVWLIFRDATSGKSTYSAGRFLYAKLGEDGQVDLDFNRAYSPPCAFTLYATCPLPPKENILSIAIEAGERFNN